MLLLFLQVLHWVISIITVLIVGSICMWPFLFNSSPYKDIAYNAKEHVKDSVRAKTDSKVLDWVYNDLLRFLLPTSAIIILAGIVLLLVLGLISFVCLLISILF